MKYLLFFLTLLICFSLKSQDSTAIEKIFAEIERIDEQYNFNDDFPRKHPKKYGYQTPEQYIAQVAEYQKQITLLQALSKTDLSRQEQISKDIMVLRLNDNVSDVKFKTYLMPFNSEGGFYNQPIFF